VSAPVASQAAGTAPETAKPLLSVRDLRKHFAIRGGILSRVVDKVHAVDGVSFDIEAGETLGVVGESGCGKSTTGRCILRLIEPSSGEVWFQGANVMKMDHNALQAMRRDMQIIFQDPYASLNPRLTIGAIIGEALIIHKLVKSRQAMEDRVVQLLETVGLRPDHMRRFPHEFSGGQRQRIGIARALAVEPKLLICDEPVSALDVSIQAQVINLLEDLQEQFGLTYLFIAHDLSVVEHISTRIAVRRRRNSTTRRSIPIRKRCCRPCRSPTRRSSANASCCRATCPTRSARPRAATSTPAARSRVPIARSARRCSKRSARGTGRRVTTGTNAPLHGAIFLEHDAPLEWRAPSNDLC